MSSLLAPIRILILLSCITGHAWGQSPDRLEWSNSLAWEGDLSERMVAGISSYADKLTKQASKEREFPGPEARSELSRLLGVIDERRPPDMQQVSSQRVPAPSAKGEGFTVKSVRWPVFKNVFGEGLLLEPDGKPKGLIIINPDCDVSP
ncbi:hypothetical protein N9B94_04165, partial [Verrucomicrobia bacterium]|nr:hypothetical protein [Verrucomicrobiota bacterium]